MHRPESRWRPTLAVTVSSLFQVLKMRYPKRRPGNPSLEKNPKILRCHILHPEPLEQLQLLGRNARSCSPTSAGGTLPSDQIPAVVLPAASTFRSIHGCSYIWAAE